MPTWNAGQYLKFAEERTRPCRDLASAIRLGDVRRIIDLGCGPGNSTAVLAERWPSAEIAGVDSSIAMIDTARREQSHRRWLVSDILEWAQSERERFDIVFSNAALHWIDEHHRLFPKLFERVRSGGVLAIQIPADFNALPHQLMGELAPQDVHVKEWHSHPPEFYYDLLAPLAADVNVWETIYQHVVPDADAIVEWYKGSGLRPFMEAFAGEAGRKNFIENYSARIRTAFPPREDGRVLFPFRRLFLIARAQ